MSIFRSFSDLVRTDCAKKIEDVEKRPELYLCDLCPKSWATDMDAEIHRKTEHMEEISSMFLDRSLQMCTICARVQESSAALVNHIMEEHLLSSAESIIVTRQLYICNYCCRIFFNKKLFTLHIYRHSIRKEHTKEWNMKIIQCPKCDKKMYFKTLWYHLILHNTTSVSTCPICLTYTPNRLALTEHIKIHKPYYCCDVCGYECDKASVFNLHYKAHEKYTLETFTGDYSMFFMPKKHLGPWRYQIQTGIKGIELPFHLRICVLCKEVCLVKHMKAHLMKKHGPLKPDVKKQHKCSCGEIFFNNVLLKHHVFKMKGHHAVVKADR